MALNTEYAEVVWTPDDVQSRRPKWSLKKCEAWLDANEKYIREAMIEAGWEAIDACITSEDEGDAEGELIEA